MPVLDDTFQLSLTPALKVHRSLFLALTGCSNICELQTLVIRRALRNSKAKSIYSNTFITRVVTFVFPMDYSQEQPQNRAFEPYPALPPKILITPTDNVNRGTTVNASRAMHVITPQTSEVRSLGQPQAFENICDSRNGQMASSHIVHKPSVSPSSTCSLSHAD